MGVLTKLLFEEPLKFKISEVGKKEETDRKKKVKKMKES